MTIRIIYNEPAGHTRTFYNRTQAEVNNIINTVNHHNELMPLKRIKIIVSG